MAIEATYLGMKLSITDADTDNREYFRYCAQHVLRLQACCECGLLRYPPTTGCPWCSEPKSIWTPVEGRGTVHSYVQVHHAIQPAFKEHTPYLVLLVELDTQRDIPSKHEALRIIGNLTDRDGRLASADVVSKVGIGSRMVLTFTDVSSEIAIPQWTLDEAANQPECVWRYP